ncbi:MAG: hypothetical protein ACI8RC_003081, partial [Ilumatobacter sp.]
MFDGSRSPGLLVCCRSDRAARSCPILVFEQTLVELAGRVAGEFFAEVDRPRALDVGDLALAELDQLASELRS